MRLMDTLNLNLQPGKGTASGMWRDKCPLRQRQKNLHTLRASIFLPLHLHTTPYRPAEQAMFHFKIIIL